MPLTLQVGSSFLQVAGLARREHDSRAGFAEGLGDLQAEAARAPGDEGRLALEAEQLQDGSAHGTFLQNHSSRISRQVGLRDDTTCSQASTLGSS